MLAAGVREEKIVRGGVSPRGNAVEGGLVEPAVGVTLTQHDAFVEEPLEQVGVAQERVSPEFQDALGVKHSSPVHGAVTA